MSRIRRHHAHQEHEQEQTQQTNTKAADHTDTDALLDEIDKLLAECEAEDEKLSFKEKLKSISFGGRARARCDQLIALPPGMGEMLGAERYDGPPCVGC